MLIPKEVRIPAKEAEWGEVVLKEEEEEDRFNETRGSDDEEEG